MRSTSLKSARSIRILIADDHEMIRESYATLLGGHKDYHFVGAAKNGEELLAMIPVLQPDFIITDIKMPVMDGIEATAFITKTYPSIKVIAFSVFGEENLVLKMLKAGAWGYLLKSSTMDELIEAIQTIKMGYPYFCKETGMTLFSMIAKSSLFLHEILTEVDFTPKDIEIIRYICEEKSNKEIASILDVNLKSVENSREKIHRKIGVKNTAGIVIYAIRSGIYKL